MAGDMTKKQAQDLSKKLMRKSKLVWDELTKADRNKAMKFGDEYKTFLDNSKTERRAVATVEQLARKTGFFPVDEAGENGLVFRTWKNKCIALARLGVRPVTEGVHIVASHVDSPRLDLKANPLYEETDMAFFKTHYYGGVRKHQWFARPLALHGVAVDKDGKSIDIRLGEDPGDPVFTVLDLLPHLARKIQAGKTLAIAFEGEKLNILLGSLPLGPEKTPDRFKLMAMNLLHEKYGLVEEDFLTAEIEAVPAGQARDVGLDRSLIGAYGQDDRVCSYCAVRALLDAKSKPEFTSVVFLADKEEIGSEGNTGAKSRFLESFISDLLKLAGQGASSRDLTATLMASKGLSGDVAPALDPDYQSVHEKNNAAKLGYGMCMTKYTGSAGKSGASDANAEHLGYVRGIFEANKIVWQIGQLGKVDEGGGGTIAKFLATHGMDVVDCGPAILGMHSPFEIASKADIFMAYKAYGAFLQGR
ncbi:MAG: aminopeptidase [Desulfatibacillum sp.]|nr:aminopeptidase [Desulfatibacillum sp.]